MSKKPFDISKLTPFPEFTVNILNNSTHHSTQYSPPYSSQQNKDVATPILLGPIIPMAPLSIDIMNTIIYPDAKHGTDKSDSTKQNYDKQNNITLPNTLPYQLIQLPDIPQNEKEEPVLQQPTMTTSTLTPNAPMTMLVPLINPVTKICTKPATKPLTDQRFTRELQLAPLSPKSPRIERKEPLIVITHSVQPVQLIKTETCCICYDDEIPTTDLLVCKHPVCGECSTHLQSPECPLCKKFLEGPLITDSILADIFNRQEQTRLVGLTTDYLAGVYLEEHPNADPTEVYDMYK